MNDSSAPHPSTEGAANRSVVLLGSTGSIGTQGLDVIRAAGGRFSVTGLTCGSQVELLARQAVEFLPGHLAVEAADVPAVRSALAAAGAPADYEPTIHAGPGASATLAARCAADVVLNGITGSIGLEPTLAALGTGATVALANKESLIVGGELVRRAAAPGQIVPVDSEHSALAQCLMSTTGPLPPAPGTEVDRLVLTASGGPFRGWTRRELETVTPAQALAHPTWDMGRVVTTNSATLVNKGLEVIEAHLLFDVPLERIDVVVHPQSIVHSMVQYVDGSTLAQCSPPDMRLPIALGLGWPGRVPGATDPCDWTQAATWTFEPLDADVFPAVELAKRAALSGGTGPAVFNAANEEAVDAFHEGAIGFLDIVETSRKVLDLHVAETAGADPELTLDRVLAAERWARGQARALMGT